jgi:hypothetical protein
MVSSVSREKIQFILEILSEKILKLNEIKK